MKIIGKIIAGLIVVSVVALNIAYWQDTVFLRRFVTALSPSEPGEFALTPLEYMGGGTMSVLPSANDTTRTVKVDALEDAREYAEQYESFSFIVVHNGRLQMEWYKPGWDQDRLTQSQSMHKTVAGLLVGAALHDGLIDSIDDTIDTYLTDWKGRPEGAIQLKDLLTMSSGLEQYAFSLNPFADKSAFRLLFTENRAELISRAVKVDESGAAFDYNELNVMIAGLIIEEVTGQRYTDYLNEKIWLPMGGQKAATWLDRPAGLPMISCCILAPARDWARIGELMRNCGRFNGKQIIPKDWIDAMISASATNPSYGYWTWRAENLKAYTDKQLEENPQGTEMTLSEELLDSDMFMLMGLGGQRVYVSRKYDLVVVRLGPAQGYQPLKPGWDNSFLVNTIIRGLKPSED